MHIDRKPLFSAYPSGIPAALVEALDHVEQVLNRQEDKVVSAVALSNFSLDSDRAKGFIRDFGAKNPISTRGLVVRLKPGYKLSSDDAAWFHPEMGKGRVVASLAGKPGLEKIREVSTTENAIGISPYNCSIGHYARTDTNEIGMATEKNVVIVDTSFESLTLPLWHSWIEEKVDVGTALAQWKDMSVSNHENISTKAREDRVALAMNVGATDVVYSDEINSLYTDGEDVFITNHAIKVPENKQIFVHTSALGGYREGRVSGDSKFVASDIGLSDNFYSWSSMSAEHKKRIQSDCSWDGGKSFNTFVLRQPTTTANLNLRASDAANGFISEGQYAMKKAKFSSQPIHDYLSTDLLVSLTPGSAPGVENHIELPLNKEHELMSEVIQNFPALQKKFPSFKLYNPALMSEDNQHIRIPREVVLHLTN